MASIDTAPDPLATVRQETRRAGAPATAPQRVAEPPRLVPRGRRDTPWRRRALVFGTCVVMADALFGDWGLSQTIRARRNYEQAATSLVRLRQDNAWLREQVRRLQDDPAAIEEVAREEQGLIRPGEILVVVRDLK